MMFIWYILIGILAGYLAGKIVRGGGMGLLVNLIVGIIGGVLGGWLFGIMGIASPDRRGEEDIAGTGGDQQTEKRRFRGG